MTTGTYRVLDGPRDGDEWLFLDRKTFDPLYVPRGGHDVDLDALEPGNLVEATVEWDGDDPLVTDLSTLKRTRFTFVDAVAELFSAAESTWRDAVAAGEGMGSRVTRDTDGDPNGALYVFAEQSGAADLFAEFRDGDRPLDPLVDRVNERRDDDHDVFVLRPAGGECVCVFVVFERGGRLAEAVREKYGLGGDGGSGLPLSGLDGRDPSDGDYPTG